MTDLPVISSLWIGPPLSFLEQLCLKSFVDAGHRTKLYTYAPVGNVPDGVEIADANAILPSTKFVVNKASGTPGPQSDKFRYHLLDQTDETWVDTDAYCLRPFPDRPIIVACHFKDVVANGVLRLPKTSKTLQDLLAFTEDEYPLLPDDFPYVGRALLRENRARHGTDDPMHVSDMPWEIWGPFAITYFMKKNGEFDQVMPAHTLYPLAGNEIVRVLQMPRRANIELPEDCLSIHFYGSRFRELVTTRDDGVPAERSLMGQLLAKHEIDPRAAPIDPR